MRPGLLLATLVLCLFSAPTAFAGPIEDFRQDGALDPCDYSPGELQQAGNSLPPDVIQYSPGLLDQLNAGREGCGGAPQGDPDPRRTVNDPADTDQDGDIDGADAAAAGTGGGGGGGGADTAEQPAASRVPDPPTPSTTARARLAEIATPPVSATTRSNVPDWVVVLLIALGLGALLFALLRSRGASTDRFATPLRASFADAGGRSSDVLAEIWDSVRLGR